MISFNQQATYTKRTVGPSSRRRTAPRQPVKAHAAQGENNLGSAILAGIAAVTLAALPVQAADGIPPLRGGFPVNIGYGDVDKSTLQRTEKTRDVVREQIDSAKSNVDGARDALRGTVQDFPGSLGGNLKQNINSVKDVAGQPAAQIGKLTDAAGEQLSGAKEQAQDLGQKVKDAIPGNLFNLNIGGKLDSNVQQGIKGVKDVADKPGAQAEKLANAAGDQVEGAKSQAQDLGQKVKNAFPGNLFSGNIGSKVDSKVQQGVQGVKDAADKPGAQAEKFASAAGDQVDGAKSQAQDLGQKVKDALPGNLFSGNIGNKLDNTVQQGVQGVKDVADKPGAQAEKLASGAGDQLDSAKSQAQDLGQKVKDAFPGNLFSGNIGGKLEQGQNKVQQGAKDIASPAAGQADRLGDALGGQAENVKSQAQDFGQKVKDVVPGNLFTGTIGGKEPVQQGVDTEQLNKEGRDADSIQSAANKGPSFRAEVEENFGDNLFDKVKKAISESAVPGTIGSPNVRDSIQDAADKLNKTTGGESLQQSGVEERGDTMSGASGVRSLLKDFSERVGGPVKDALPTSFVQGVIGAAGAGDGQQQGEKVKDLESNTPRYEEAAKNLAASTRGRVENLGNVVMNAPASDSDAEGTKLAPKY